MKTYSINDLKKMTPTQRGNLYQNARKLRDQGGQEIMDLLDLSGLPLSDGDMKTDDPVFIRMEEIIWSPLGRQSALDAVGNGLPALAGVDPLISTDLGNQYTPHNSGTVNAGYILAGLMRHLGYVEDGQGKCPDSCVAKTGLKWKLRLLR